MTELDTHVPTAAAGAGAVTGKSNNNNNNNNDTRKLRQRARARIIHDKKEDRRIENIIQQSIMKNSSQRSSHFWKTFMIIFTALCCTAAAMIKNNPNLIRRLLRRHKDIPTFHFATKYPNNVILGRDLPLFFRFYSIATPENEFAQDAVRKVCNSRTQLRKRAGKIKTILKAWDESNIENLLNQDVCGNEFVDAYRASGITQQRKDDLLMWCLMATRVTEGFFMEDVEIIDSPLFLTRSRGIVILKKPTDNDGHGGELSTLFYLHPRTDKNEINWIPSKILAMLISNSQKEKDDNEEEGEDDDDIQEMIQKLLYDMVITQGNEDDFLILEEICGQENRPERSIAIDRSSSYNDGGDGDCYFVVPEKYGGIFKAKKISDDDE
jgi:hypothetical protein